MRQYTLSELNRRPGELVDEALETPIILTKRGRPHLVVMSAKRFEELKGKPLTPPKTKLNFAALQNPK